MNEIENIEQAEPATPEPVEVVELVNAVDAFGKIHSIDPGAVDDYLKTGVYKIA